MTTDRRSRRPINYFRDCHVVPFPKHYPHITWINPNTINNISVMTRHCTRGHIFRSSHTPSAKRTTIRNNFIYYIRSFLLPGLLLSLLSLKPSTNPRTWGMLTANRNHHPGPIRSPSTEYSRPPGLRCYSHLGPPQHYRRRT